MAAVEVAAPGQVVRILSNPYGIATFFGLSPEETQAIVPIARALIGNRSAVVLKTPQGDVQSRVIPAGNLYISGEKRRGEADVAEGAEAIMQAMSACAPVRDIRGEPGTHAGGMLERVRKVMASLTGHEMSAIYIQDLLAVDTFIPRKVQGGMAGECAMENAVGMAAMVKADRLQMQVIARELSARLQTEVVVGGVEANMAIAGALTTPGCAAPLAILDLGAGSTDAAIVNAEGQITAVHLAGAGNMVSLLIKTELGLEDLSLAEAIKSTRWPKWKACSVFVTRMARWSSFGKPSARRCSPKWCTSRRANWCRSITPARWKNSSRAPAGERESVCHQLPARAAPGLTRRFHSRYRLCGAGGRLIAGL